MFPHYYYSFVTSTIIFRIMASAKIMPIFMQIIVLDRTRTTSSSGTWHGEQFTSFMSQSFILFSSLATQSLGPDHCFGMIKKSYKVNYVSSLYEFAKMVKSSSTVGVDTAQLVGTHDGKVIVPVYNWSAFLEQYFVKVPKIKTFHYFQFSKDEPGKLYFKQYSTAPEQSLMLLKNPTILPPAVLPPEVSPQGLSQERKQYLYREIRQFCKPGTEDLVASVP